MFVFVAQHFYFLLEPSIFRHHTDRHSCMKTPCTVGPPSRIFLPPSRQPLRLYVDPLIRPYTALKGSFQITHTTGFFVIRKLNNNHSGGRISFNARTVRSYQISLVFFVCRCFWGNPCRFVSKKHNLARRRSRTSLRKAAAVNSRNGDRALSIRG